MKHRTDLRTLVPTAVAILLVCMVSAAVAAPTGEVAAEVQTLEYSITVDAGDALSFGAVDFGDSATPDLGKVVVVTNTGTMPAMLLVQGENAQNDDGHVWQLKDAPGPCEFAWSLTSDDDPSRPVKVGTVPRVLDERIDAGESVSFTPTLEMPIASMYTGEFTWTTYICATAYSDS